MSDQPRRLTVTVKACELTGLSRASIWRLMAARKLEFLNIGRKRLIQHDSLERLTQPQK